MGSPSRHRALLTRERAILRAIRQTEELGLTVVGAYDALFNVDDVSWADVRSRNPGPTITLTGSPTLSNGVLSFDGAAQYGRASGGRLGEITADHWMVLIASINGTEASRQMAAISRDATRTLMMLYSGATSTTSQSQTGTATTTGVNYVNPMVLHGSRVRAGGNITVSHRRGTDTENTASVADADLAVTRFTVGASPADTAAAFANVSIRAVVFGTGAGSAAQQAIWNQYGALRGARV